MTQPYQVLKRGAMAGTDLDSDAQLEYDINEENTLELDFRFKKLPGTYNTALLKKTKDQLALTEDEKKGHPGIVFELNDERSEFMTNFYFSKKISYLSGPSTLLALDIEHRSLDGIKFYGLRPTVTHQLDKMTLVKFGFSAMPGSTAFIIGASREIAKDM